MCPVINLPTDSAFEWLAYRAKINSRQYNVIIPRKVEGMRSFIYYKESCHFMWEIITLVLN